MSPMRSGVGDGRIVPMLHPDHPIETAVEALHYLEDLRFELALAGPAGMLDNAGYVDELHDDIEASTQVFVGLAVTEIASLRAELDGRLEG